MNSMPLPPGENKANAIAALLLLAVVAAGAISASSAKIQLDLYLPRRAIPIKILLLCRVRRRRLHPGMRQQ